MNILAKLLLWVVGPALPIRSSWVYCWNCKRDLNGDNSSYVREVGPYDYVWYKCASCGHHSVFDFGAPAAILLSKSAWVDEESTT